VATIYSVWKEDLFLPALVSRLENDPAVVRPLTIEALDRQGTTAAAALPALRAAYANELTQSGSRDPLQAGYYGEHIWTAQEIRWAIREAVDSICQALFNRY
jgi:hypothetical protein